MSNSLDWTNGCYCWSSWLSSLAIYVPLCCWSIMSNNFHISEIRIDDSEILFLTSAVTDSPANFTNISPILTAVHFSPFTGNTRQAYVKQLSHCQYSLCLFFRRISTSLITPFNCLLMFTFFSQLFSVAVPENKTNKQKILEYLHIHYNKSQI